MSGEETFDKVKTGVFILVVIMILMYIFAPSWYETYILMNDPIYRFNYINSMRFKDIKLNKLLNEMSIIIKSSIEHFQYEFCKNKDKLIEEIKKFTKTIEMDRMTMDELNMLCKKNAIKNSDYQLFMKNIRLDRDPVLMKLFEKLFEIYYYASVKYLCKNEKFDIKMLEEYLIAMVEDICSNNSNIHQLMHVNSEFMIRKPLSYTNL